MFVVMVTQKVVVTITINVASLWHACSHGNPEGYGYFYHKCGVPHNILLVTVTQKSVVTLT